METKEPEQVALPLNHELVAGNNPVNVDASLKCEQDEIIEYLMDTVRLAKKKTRSKKLPDVVKVKWCKVAVDASKALLFSGVLNRRQKSEASTLQAFFIAIRNKNLGNTECLNTG